MKREWKQDQGVYNFQTKYNGVVLAQIRYDKANRKYNISIKNGIGEMVPFRKGVNGLDQAKKIGN